MIKVDGASLSFASHGQLGPWVTLVNGHSRSMDDFKAMIRFLLRHGFRVATLDNRGSGQTTVTRPFQLKDMIGDILAVWEYLGIARSHLLGISMGGIIAQNVAAFYPDKVERLVLVSTTCDQKWMHYIGQGWGSNLASVKEKLSHYVTPGFIAKNQLLFESMSKQILKSIEMNDFNNRSSMQTDAIGEYNTMSILAKIKNQTLIVHGSDDQIIDVDVVAEFSRYIADVKELILNDIGHLILAESPKEFYQSVVEFLLLT